MLIDEIENTIIFQYILKHLHRIPSCCQLFDKNEAYMINGKSYTIGRYLLCIVVLQ